MSRGEALVGPQSLPLGLAIQEKHGKYVNAVCWGFADVAFYSRLDPVEQSSVNEWFAIFEIPAVFSDMAAGKY